MNKFFIRAILFFLVPVSLLADTPAAPTQPMDATSQQLIIAYNYAYSLYQGQRFDQAKDLFRKLAAASMQPIINGNSLYYYSQCAFRTGDYDGCVKGLDLLAKRWPDSPAISKGYVSRFATFIIDQVATLQTNWDYYRYKDNTLDEKGNPIWKESVPTGYKIKRINFKLGFGLYKILLEIEPTSTETVSAKQKLDSMLNQSLKILWVDEKAPVTRYGHPADFYSGLSENEKKHFSKVICDRIFYNWETDKLCDFFDVYDNVENFKPKFIAKTKENPDSSLLDQTTVPGVLPPLPGNPPVAGAAPLPSINPPMFTAVTNTPKDPTDVLTLANLFQVAGYNPYTDTFTTLTETIPPGPGM